MRRVLGNVMLTIGAMGVFAASAHAGTIDLTSAGSSGSANGALYQQIDPQSTGTGVIDPFLRVQDIGIEDGYNTSQNPPYPDVKTGTWTHDLLFSDLNVVTVSGTTYYQFLLDINQTNANPFLSLNEVEIYTTNTEPSPLPGPTDPRSQLGTLRFDMDAGVDGDTTVEMNYDLNPGSGAGDMFLYVPTALFAGVSPDAFVYFYTAFGDANGGNDGFEEWALLEGTTTTVPDGGLTAGMLGMAMLGFGLFARRKTT